MQDTADQAMADTAGFMSDSALGEIFDLDFFENEWLPLTN